ncbi:Cell division control protein [Drechslerella dactyloides]|uniref:Cell division control protein n=1 Tax=Drechslerella dactyloides TaxID=74499 RepID=A0AAD6NMI1_DREDA|nr:Cell division control protein [Drechslerella dactyloides]
MCGTSCLLSLKPSFRTHLHSPRSTTCVFEIYHPNAILVLQAATHPPPSLKHPATMTSTKKTLRDFPKPTRQHIINCGYPSWYPKYRSVIGRARVVPLTPGFLDYLREDGIVLPDENLNPPTRDNDSGVFSSANDDDDEYEDPSYRFTDVHEAVKAAIADLGGNVYPKLNWSAPKDASFILGNTLKCATASDVYLLLKSSNFVTHDLEHAFDDTDDTPDENGRVLQNSDIQYALVLRKWVEVIPSVEFRCFVKDRKLVCFTQRDMNHYQFLEDGREEFTRLITEFFEKHMQTTFPDPNFVFDVYVPKTLMTAARVWLMDVNPYAPRTDPLLFSWTEILNIDPHVEGFEPEFRLIGRDDPEAYNFSSSQYSAHKLPKEVVDAGVAGPQSIAEFSTRWREIVEGLEGADLDDSSSSEDAEDDNEDAGDGSDGTADEKEVKADSGKKAIAGEKK